MNVINDSEAKSRKHTVYINLFVDQRYLKLDFGVYSGDMTVLSDVYLFSNECSSAGTCSALYCRV